MDSNSLALMSLGSLFAGGSAVFLQTNFLYSVVCALIAVGCFMLREVVKQ